MMYVVFILLLQFFGQEFTPPGTVKVGELYVDKTEILIIHWLEYEWLTKQDKDSVQLQSLQPDSSMSWYRNSKSRFLPMTMITLKQAEGFCQWRSKVVSEKFRVKVKYRLPTPKEWTIIAKQVWKEHGKKINSSVKKINESIVDAGNELLFDPRNEPGSDKSTTWNQIIDPDGFYAPFGLTTAERRHPEFRTHGCCKCEWDGAVWPFATSQTLKGMANLLNDYEQEIVTDSTYFDILETYVESQYYRGRPYIGEYLDETTGYWLKGDQERSRYYNHSTFNDLIITGLVGLRPRADNVIEVNPLVPDGKWDWFALDQVNYAGKSVSIIWDKDGTKYGKGAGLKVFADGTLVASSAKLERVTGEL